MKRKAILVLVIVMLASMLLSACGGSAATTASTTAAANTSKLVADAGEKYYMVTFASDSPYWVDVLDGFKDAFDLYGAEVEYTGIAGADVAEQVALIEQIITKKPAGIAIAAANADGIVPVIEKAKAAGIMVVNFDAKAASGTYGFIGTGNFTAGAVAAREMGKLLDGKGKIGVVTVIDTDSCKNRSDGFIATIEAEFPGMEVVQTVDGKFDQAISADVTSAMIQANPDIAGVFASFAAGGVGVATALGENNKLGSVKVISFDTDPGTLDLIKAGTIQGTMAQGTWVMGWQSANQLFWLKHNLMDPKPGWKENGISPLPNNVDTGITFVTKENADLYYPAK